MAQHLTINDGGREASGYKGYAGDCVVRAIAIASERPYKEVYDTLRDLNQAHMDSRRNTKVSRKMRKKFNKSTPRDGNYKEVYHNYILSLGFVWTPKMKVGVGCKTHLRADELPSKGRLICRLSRHLCAFIDGTIHDTYDPSRGGTRCVYGYYTLKSSKINP